MINKYISKKAGKKGFSDKDIYSAYKIFFGTLFSEPRLRIINLLRQGKKNVSEIIDELNMDQSSVSHHLSRLRTCGFVECETKGKFRYYKLNQKTIRPLMSLIDKHMSGHCIHILEKRRKK